MSNQLQHRLLHFEVEPPAAMWDTISEALDEQTTPAAEKLRSFETAPPTHLWQQIETGLDSKAETPSQTVPFYQRHLKALRYGSAAAVLLLVALTITLLVNNTGDSNKVARQTPNSGQIEVAQQPGEAPLRPTGDPEVRAPRSQAIEPGERTENGTTATATEDNTPDTKTPQRPPSSRYLTVATEEGQPVRLSKKVFPVFDCAEHSSALERFQCQENIEALQKMASSLTSPSGDFASLIDMIKTLEENR